MNLTEEQAKRVAGIEKQFTGPARHGDATEAVEYLLDLVRPKPWTRIDFGNESWEEDQVFYGLDSDGSVWICRWEHGEIRPRLCVHSTTGSGRPIFLYWQPADIPARPTEGER